MLVRYSLSLDDHLAWYDHCVAEAGASRWSSWPVIGRLISNRRRKGYARSLGAERNRFALGERTVELAATGIREFAAGFDFTTPWQELAQVIITLQHLFLTHPSMNAHVIPLRCFANEAERDAFLSFVFTHAASARESRKGPSSPP